MTEFTEIVGPGSNTTQTFDTDGIVVANVIGLTLSRINMHGVGHGLHFNGTSGACNVSLLNSYLWGMASGPQCHFEQVYYGGNGIGGGDRGRIS